MNILITGVQGFVGSNRVIALQERHTIYGLNIIAHEKEGVVKYFYWEDIEQDNFQVRNFHELDEIIYRAGK